MVLTVAIANVTHMAPKLCNLGIEVSISLIDIAEIFDKIRRKQRIIRRIQHKGRPVQILEKIKGTTGFVVGLGRGET